MNDLIFISLEAWDEIWRRNQFVCAELARRHPRHKILFVTPPRDVSNAVRTMNWARFRPVVSWSPKGLSNVVVFTPTKWLPNSLQLGRAVNAMGLRRQILEHIRQLQLVKPILWINDHAASNLVGRMGEVAVVYDVTDDWISFNRPGVLRERIRIQDEFLCRRADAVIVCSERLRALKLIRVREASRLHLIANGVHSDHYASVPDRSLPIPGSAQKWPRPVFGYTGTIHPERVDLDLIEDVARRVKCGSFVFIGPNFLSRADQARLEKTGRVLLHRAIPYSQVPDYMRAFDVLTVPHRTTEFVESLNPLKLWEYMAAGKPIVSTNVAGFRDYPEHVRIARNAPEFADAIVDAVGESADRSAGRQAEARQNSWGSRVDEIERTLISCLAIRQQ